MLTAPNTPSAPQTSASVPATPNVTRLVAERVELAGDEVELLREVLQNELEDGVAVLLVGGHAAEDRRARASQNGNSDSSA